MSKEAKNRIVPELRFPEFRNTMQWEEKQLGDIGEFIGGGTPDTTVPEYWDGIIQWFTPTEIKERDVYKSKRTITEEGLKNSSAKILPKGALLITTRATIGDIGIAQNECTTNQGFQSLIVNNSEVNIFWYYWIIQNKSELVRKASGSTFPEIGKNEIIKIKSFRPEKDEQQKIADCLSSLDEYLTAQNQKLEALKAHKKGLMQQLFPVEGKNVPKLRFKEFSENGKWDEKTLGDVAIFLKGKGISKSDISITGSQPCIRYGELYTQYTEIINSPISFTNLPYEDLILSEANDVIIPSSGETREDIATASCVLNGGIALGGDLNILRSEINGVFLAYYLTHTQKRAIAKLAQGDAVVHLYSSQLKKLTINFPKSKHEQQKIADCLSSLDELINAQAEKIEELKRHKKGLMQELFPASNQGGNVPEVAKPIITKNKNRKVTAIPLSDEEKRDLLGGYIISKADAKKNFGHIKFVKHMVMVEYYAETKMPTEYHQHNNGPYDKNFMQQLAYRLKQKQWFEEYKLGNSYAYRPLAKAGEIEGLFAKVFPAKKDAIDFVINLMNRATPEQAEILATVYAVWNDLLLNKIEVNPDEIKKYFFKWSEHKRKSFTPKQVEDCYKWMWKEKFIPKGKGRLIMNLF